MLADPAAIENPFYRLVPDAFLVPIIILATAATVIASQAVITGAYSITQQAIQLGLLPRFAIRHTSASRITSYNVCYTKLLRTVRRWPGDS